MTSVMQPLHDEHHELFPRLELLRVAAEGVGTVPLPVLREEVDAAIDFLAHSLLPHAEAEERVLYPIVGEALGSPRATATMSRDHTEVLRRTHELQSVAVRIPHATDTDLRNLRRVLYGLYAVVELHFAKEEEIYLPVLESYLSAEAAHTMFEALERAAAEAKTAGHPA